MSRHPQSVALALGLSLALFACDGSPTSVESELVPQPRFAAVPNPVFFPFAFTVENCVELVDVTGTFHPNVKILVGPNGKLLFRFHINAKGTGIGQVTGATYQWNDRLFDITNVAPAGAVTFILNDHTRLIGQGDAVNTRFRIWIKVTINANGDVTVDDFRLVAICD